MIYPIVPYGDPVLRKVAKPIKLGSIDLIKLSEDMFETMYAAEGIGLAAPQIGKNIRLIIIDTKSMSGDFPDDDLDNFCEIIEFEINKTSKIILFMVTFINLEHLQLILFLFFHYHLICQNA